ncbi:MAG: endonuclease III [Deltaproteobacteria bacterium]|nr:endonuclease III [Deltaproteobacteria bacterium]
MGHASDRKLLKEFEALYPDPRSELNFSSDYQLIVSVILSAQCTDKKVNEVTPQLFSTYPSFEALSKAMLPKLEKSIRPINYYRSKAKNLLSMAKVVHEKHHDKLPRSRSELEELAGVGRKTASVILSQLGIEPALAVDTHVFRVARRLHLASSEKRDEVEQQLRERFPKEIWHHLHHWLIFHGRRVCKAQRPACEQCAVAVFCPSRQSSTIKKAS